MIFKRVNIPAVYQRCCLSLLPLSKVKSKKKDNVNTRLQSLRGKQKLLAKSSKMKIQSSRVVSRSNVKSLKGCQLMTGKPRDLPHFFFRFFYINTLITRKIILPWTFASVIFSFSGYGLAVENNKSFLIPGFSSRPSSDVKFLFHFGHKAWFFV